MWKLYGTDLDCPGDDDNEDRRDGFHEDDVGDDDDDDDADVDDVEDDAEDEYSQVTAMLMKTKIKRWCFTT